MNLDIGNILANWPYEPGQVTARRIRGRDGKDKIQLRLDLGILQMEARGRPDGRRPHGCRSLLNYYRKQLERFRKRHGNDKGFSLDERACELLRTEGMMYYHRYLAEFVLGDFEAVVRDTRRNLCLTDFCNAYAQETSDRYVLEQYRPYVLMMNARARSQRSLRDRRPKAALAAVREGIEEIEDFFHRFGEEKMTTKSNELAVLRAMAGEIEARIPKHPLEKLHDALEQAVSEERYEEAAAIRDKISRARGNRARW